MCLPDSAAFTIRSACVSVDEQISTTPTALSAKTSATAATFAPERSASACAAFAFWSTTYVSFAPDSFARLPAWIVPIRPAPKSATSIMGLDARARRLRGSRTLCMLPEIRSPLLHHAAVRVPVHEERHPFRRRTPARRRLPGSPRRRLLRAADRRAAGRRRELRQVPGRFVREHGVRLRAARAPGGDGVAHRRRRDGPLPRRDAREGRM